MAKQNDNVDDVTQEELDKLEEELEEEEEEQKPVKKIVKPVETKREQPKPKVELDDLINVVQNLDARLRTVESSLYRAGLR